MVFIYTCIHINLIGLEQREVIFLGFFYELFLKDTVTVSNWIFLIVYD